MSDTFTAVIANTPQTQRPQYHVGEFTTTSSLEQWLNDHPDYRFVSMTPISVTNHFSKEMETTVWVVAELRNDTR